jgi:hypothetical protein
MFLPGRDKQHALQKSATLEPNGSSEEPTLSLLDEKVVEKYFSQAAQKDSEARRVKIDKRRRTLVR